MEKSFAITTLGCKLNQYESECIRHDLEQHGWKRRSFDSQVDFYIINTCTVTAKTDARCRNAIRRARRRNPDSKILVTGCYAQTQPEKLEKMKEVDFVFDNIKKGFITGFLEDYMNERETGDPAAKHISSLEIDIDSFTEHSRAFIKVQDGCDSHCSYCIIPEARGSSKSISPEDVIRKVKCLADNNYEEIVLTGIHIGRYGRDLENRVDLADLIESILNESDRLRIRLSSIEPNEVTGKLADMIIGNRRVASHLHIPLQSGDDEILEAMRRPYSTKKYRKLIVDLKERSGDVIIGTDIIVGFPGETDRHFKNTYSFLKGLPIDYFHVFSYSKRPGTPASRMKMQVEPSDKKTRSRKLIRLGNRKKRDFMRNTIGKHELALIQGPARKYSRFSTCLTGNYCEVKIKCPLEMTGKLAEINITHYSRGRLYGRLVESLQPQI
ncbi:MAG: tRNA (N(6)-L-threonylcarbamoyladenosine(37)-C(2))-methylthiotransferase MtaB [Candidatus Krumholzibacteriota bacterium]|nr:tRNA (N(6)-L-threonylcarbamoyladenosine(37)-C(2))-methylthiotransferase MtaB [Candidatus Krumholzibacteriota bacterium]